MNAEKYATENSETSEDVFKLYHAFKAGEMKGSNDKTFFPMIGGIMMGIVICLIIIKFIKTSF